MKTNYKVHLEGSGIIASCAVAAHAAMIHALYPRAVVKWGTITLLKKGERAESPAVLMETRRLAALDAQRERWKASQERYAAERSASLNGGK